MSVKLKVGPKKDKTDKPLANQEKKERVQIKQN